MPQRNLSEILAKISDGFCVLDKDGHVQYRNEKASQIFEGADAGFHDRIHGCVEDHAAIRFEHFHLSLNRWFEHQTYPNEDGGMTLVSRDVTSRHRLEEALRASEERFQRVIESNIVGVVVVEGDEITEANDVFLKMVGYTRSDVVTRQLRWRDMTPPEYDDLDAAAQRQFRTAGLFSSYEKEFIKKSGGRVPISIAGVGTGNNPDETFCLVLDLTERKRAEDRIRSVVEASKILASSLECEITFAELASFVAANLADSCTIFVKEGTQIIRMATAQAMPIAKEETELDLTYVMTSGKMELVRTPTSRALVPIIARDTVAGVFAVTAARPDAFNADDLHLFEELGRRAGLALESSRLYHEAQKANRLKDEFVAIVSHELRTPLTPILGGVYMMRTEGHDETLVARALDLIERNAKTQVKIVDDLLDVSRALSGKMRLNLEAVDLTNVVKAAVETVRPAIEAKAIQIKLNLPPLAGVIWGDADRLQQVVWNLLANAVKFTASSGEIAIEVVETPAQAEIRVTDTGIGIEPEFLPYVFERFRQADTSRTRSHGGLGLGLAIVRHVVESHGGTVHAYSSGETEGSTFVVKLPFRIVGKTVPL